MEKLIYKITVGEWDYFSNTGDFEDLKKYGVNEKNIVELTDIVYEIINGGTQENDNKKDQLNSDYKIQELTAYFQALHTFYVHELKIKDWLRRSGIKFEDNRIEELIKSKTERLKQRFGIVVESWNDLERIEKEIERRLDKYEERFKIKEQIKEGITFSELLISVFRVLGYDKIDYDMKLSGFFHLKDRVLKNG